MRFALLVVAALLVAGCASISDTTQPAGTPGPSPGGGASEGGSNDGSGRAAPPSSKTICASQQGCTFWDESYHELALYDVDAYQLDVLIVPSASADSAQDTATIKKAILAWGAGIKALGEPWFASNFTMSVYVLGADSPPIEALEDPEIVVVAAEYDPAVLFGIGYQTPATPCRGGPVEKQYAPHVHDGMTIYAAKCAQGGLSCVALNTNFLLGSQAQLYDLVAHEFGHCLGGGHVGDAMDFSAKIIPERDVMSYQHDEKQVHCVSNMNVRVLEALYAPLLSAQVPKPLAAGDYYAFAPSDYAQVACANP